MRPDKRLDQQIRLQPLTNSPSSRRARLCLCLFIIFRLFKRQSLEWTDLQEIPAPCQRFSNLDLFMFLGFTFEYRGAKASIHRLVDHPPQRWCVIIHRLVIFVSTTTVPYISDQLAYQNILTYLSATLQTKPPSCVEPFCQTLYLLGVTQIVS